MNSRVIAGIAAIDLVFSIVDARGLDGNLLLIGEVLPGVYQ